MVEFLSVIIVILLAVIMCIINAFLYSLNYQGIYSNDEIREYFDNLIAWKDEKKEVKIKNNRSQSSRPRGNKVSAKTFYKGKGGLR